jgi:hypothetical protein
LPKLQLLDTLTKVGVLPWYSQAGTSTVKVVPLGRPSTRRMKSNREGSGGKVKNCTNVKNVVNLGITRQDAKYHRLMNSKMNQTWSKRASILLVLKLIMITNKRYLWKEPTPSFLKHQTIMLLEKELIIIAYLL